MSTEFHPEPNTLPYERFIREVTGIKISSPKRQAYTIAHNLMTHGSNNIWVFDNNGIVAFERFGMNKVGDMFRLIENQFDVNLISYYGLHWAEDND
jgi:hypothetical protein